MVPRCRVEGSLVILGIFFLFSMQNENNSELRVTAKTLIIICCLFFCLHSKVQLASTQICQKNGLINGGTSG